MVTDLIKEMILGIYFIEKKGKWLPARSGETSKIRSLNWAPAVVFVKTKSV